MDCSMPGLPVHHQLPEFTQTHVHWVGDAIQPSHPLLSPPPPARILFPASEFSYWGASPLVSHWLRDHLAMTSFPSADFSKHNPVIWSLDLLIRFSFPSLFSYFNVISENCLFYHQTIHFISCIIYLVYQFPIMYDDSRGILNCSSCSVSFCSLCSPLVFVIPPILPFSFMFPVNRPYI